MERRPCVEFIFQQKQLVQFELEGDRLSCVCACVCVCVGGVPPPLFLFPDLQKSKFILYNGRKKKSLHNQSENFFLHQSVYKFGFVRGGQRKVGGV